MRRRALNLDRISWRDFWATSPPDPDRQADFIRAIERNVGLCVKALTIIILFYYLYFSNWFDDVTTEREIALEIVRRFFLIYFVANLAFGSILVGMDQLPLPLVTRVVFTSNFMDTLLVSALTLVTGGFDSVLFWVYIGLLLRNTVSVPIPVSQLFLNLVSCACYGLAGVLDVLITRAEQEAIDGTAEPFVLRIFLLILFTVCCYGLQVLLERQRRSAEEAREFSQRQQQLQAAGRLAAEIAHQLKNPLGIINNAAFTLRRTVKEGKTITQQIEIIREEVERSDRIITELMGYAKLVEGRVEKLHIDEELDAAVRRVFPTAVKFDIEIQRKYANALPPLLVQRAHLSEVLVNILQNAREAMNSQGNITLTTECTDDYSVLVKIADNGPGIDPKHLPNIFEPYYTTKSSGTGLGLAIVRHNVEIYGGSVLVESELGKGTRFTLKFPARTVMRLKS